MAVASEAASPAPPALGADTLPRDRVTEGAGQVALTLLLAVRCPPAWLTAAGSCERVAEAVRSTLAWELAQFSPAAGIAAALAAYRVTLPMGMAGTALPAIRAPVLVGAAGAAMGSKESRFAAADPRSHTHLVHLASILPFTQRSCALPAFLFPARAACQVCREAGSLAHVPPTRVQLLSTTPNPWPKPETKE